MTEIISMVNCPYCGDSWVREDTELVCEKCEPALRVDLAVADLVGAINNLDEIASPEVRARIDLIMSAHAKLGKLIRKAKPRTRDNVDES